MNPIVRNHLFRHPRRISTRLSESKVQPPLNIGLDFLRSIASGSRITSRRENKLGSQLEEKQKTGENINRKEMGKERSTTDGGGKDGKDIKQYLSHIERTAAEPRDESLHNFILTQVTRINSTTRLFYLSPFYSASDSSPKYLTWKPGQWIDLYLPGIQRPGGFSIVNIPSSQSSHSNSDLKEEKEKGIELAIQKPILKLNSEGKISDQVAWLFQPSSEILGKEVAVRIGGSFTWPPSCWDDKGSKGYRKDSAEDRNRVVFIAGGMGINPLMSMVSCIHVELGENEMNREEKIGGKDGDDKIEGNADENKYENLEVKFLYSTKVPTSIPAGGERKEEEEEEAILFLDRLQEIFKKREQWDLQLFVTGSSHDTIELSEGNANSNMETHHRRISNLDIDLALGTMEEKARTIVYICGPPTMTDSMVSYVRNLPGIDPPRVLCEKWCAYSFINFIKFHRTLIRDTQKDGEYDHANDCFVHSLWPRPSWLSKNVLKGQFGEIGLEALHNATLRLRRACESDTAERHKTIQDRERIYQDQESLAAQGKELAQNPRETRFRKRERDKVQVMNGAQVTDEAQRAMFWREEEEEIQELEFKRGVKEQGYAKDPGFFEDLSWADPHASGFIYQEPSHQRDSGIRRGGQDVYLTSPLPLTRPSKIRR